MPLPLLLLMVVASLGCDADADVPMAFDVATREKEILFVARVIRHSSFVKR